MRESVKKIDVVNISITSTCHLKPPRWSAGRLNAHLARSGSISVALSHTAIEPCKKIFKSFRPVLGANNLAPRTGLRAHRREHRSHRAG